MNPKLSSVLSDIITNSVSVEMLDCDIENSYLIYSEESNALDTLNRAADDLERLLVTVESSDGKLDSVANKAIDINLSLIARNVGIESLPTQISLESSAEYSAEERYTVTLEGIQETLSKFILAIKNAILRAWKAISDFFKRIFGGYKAMLKKITTLTDRVNRIKASGIDGKVRIRSMSKLSYDGKFDVKNIERIGGAAKFMMDVYPTEVSKYFESLKKFILVVKNNELSIKNNGDYLGEFFEDELKATKAKHNWEVYGGVVFNGGEIINKNDGKLSSFPMFRASPPNFTFSSKAEAESQEVDVLDTHVIKNVLDQMKQTINYMDKKQSVIDEIQKGAESVRKNIDDQIKVTVSASLLSDIQQKHYIVNVFKGLLRNLGKNWSAPIAQFVKITFGVIRTVLEYCEKSILAYEDKNSKASTEPKGFVVNADKQIGYNPT